MRRGNTGDVIGRGIGVGYVVKTSRGGSAQRQRASHGTRHPTHLVLSRWKGQSSNQDDAIEGAVRTLRSGTRRLVRNTAWEGKPPTTSAPETAAIVRRDV